MSHGLLKDKVVVVTAAAGTGIGASTARRAQEEGAVVVLSDRHERRLAETAEALAKDGVVPLAVPCDVTDEAQVRALVDAVIARHGRIDVWVNNAGLGLAADVVDLTDAQWDTVIGVSLTSVMRCTRAVLPHMIANKSGCIVNNASVLGWRAQRGQAAYAAAKAGVMAFTRCVAMEAADHGIRVNAVAPSLAMHAFLSKVTPPGLLEDLERREAFGRAATPDEVANVILFLASDLASYMTGEVLAVSSQHP